MLRKIMADVLSIDEQDADTNISDCPTWTSLAHIELLAAIEEAYGIELTPDEAIDIDSFESICEVLADRGLSAE